MGRRSRTCQLTNYNLAAYLRPRVRAYRLALPAGHAKPAWGAQLPTPVPRYGLGGLHRGRLRPRLHASWRHARPGPVLGRLQYPHSVGQSVGAPELELPWPTDRGPVGIRRPAVLRHALDGI